MTIALNKTKAFQQKNQPIIVQYNLRSRVIEGLGCLWGVVFAGYFQITNANAQISNFQRNVQQPNQTPRKDCLQ